MSRKFKSWEQYEKIRLFHHIVYDSWKASHKLSCNYTGLATNMERVRTLNIFERSVVKYKLRYTDFYGDGESKSHKVIEDVYLGVKKVQKRKCIGHIQKRAGNHLQKLKELVKGLGGKGKLNNVIIDRLQNYYGITTRSNFGDLENMKKTHLLVFFMLSLQKRPSCILLIV